MGEGVTYLEILQKVQLEALLWGIGTAIGELPPYFVARAGIILFYSLVVSYLYFVFLARLSGMRLEEEEAEDTSFIGKLKNYVPNIVTNLGFFAILLFASVRQSIKNAIPS